MFPWISLKRHFSSTLLIMTYLLNLIKYVILMLVQNIRCLMTITDLVLTADLEQQEAHRTEDSPCSQGWVWNEGCPLPGMCHINAGQLRLEMRLKGVREQIMTMCVVESPCKCQRFCSGFHPLEQLGVYRDVLGVPRLTSLWPSYIWGFLCNFFFFLLLLYLLHI